MTLLEQTALTILRAATSANVGIEIKITAPDGMNSPALRAKQILYRFKNENPEFKNLQIRLAPTDPNNRLWLVKQQEDF